jgi:YVTN family beta-propeller protein
VRGRLAGPAGGLAKAARIAGPEANAFSNSVTPINLLTNKPGKPIKVGVWPEGIAVTPDGATAYVVNNLSDTVTPIHTATNKPGTPIKVGLGPEDIAIK